VYVYPFMPEETVRETMADSRCSATMDRNGRRITISGSNLVVERSSRWHLPTHPKCNPGMKQQLQHGDVKGSCNVRLPDRGRVPATFTRPRFPSSGQLQLPRPYPLPIQNMESPFFGLHRLTARYVVPKTSISHHPQSHDSSCSTSPQQWDMTRKRFTLNPSRILNDFGMRSSPSQSPSFHLF
jgi:hypothetical protein